MSLQWQAIVSVLYFEIGLTLLLILPLLKPKRWKWIFSMRVFSAIRPVWTTVYFATLLILVVLFVDSIRTMVKYGDPLPGTPTLDAKIERHLQECRGQRNFYITGFALFLILVIRRLITMLAERGTLEASHAATLRQAEAANRELTRRIEESERRDQRDGEGEEPKKTKGPSQEEFEALQEELKKAQTDLQAMKKQAESTNKEYDRVTEEFQKLQNRLQELEVEEESKKDQ